MLCRISEVSAVSTVYSRTELTSGRAAGSFDVVETFGQGDETDLKRI